MHRVALVFVLLLLVARAAAAPLDDLAASDPRAVAAAVDAIEHGAPDADALFAAARACELRLHDPAHAARLYERIVREQPDARVALSAQRRGETLRAELGPHDEYAAQAAAFSDLVATADTLTPEQVIARADTVAAGNWPGTPDVELWLAGWLHGRGRFRAALRVYGELARRWPSSPQALDGARDAASCALDAKDWDLAQQLATQLPGGNPVEDAARAELIAAAKRGRRQAALEHAAWLALLLALAVLGASLYDAIHRGGRRWPALRPPVEAMFLAPLATLLCAIAWLGQRTIAPAVTRISVTGIVLGWLSGAALDLLRARGRPARARSLVHVAACVLGVVAIAYISIVHDNLIDLLKTAGQPQYDP
ncbi:MAG: tetratricopeptide repeat protein [Acidobacteriota bacterium]